MTEGLTREVIGQERHVWSATEARGRAVCWWDETSRRGVGIDGRRRCGRSTVHVRQRLPVTTARAGVDSTKCRRMC